MYETEYLAFIPLLLYGLGIADLINHWRRYLNREHFYLPYLFSGFLLLELGIFSVYEYLQLTSELTSDSYGIYLLHLIPPILYLAMCKIFTPEKGIATKEYFTINIPLLFSLGAVFNISHFMFDYGSENPYLLPARILVVVLLLAFAYTRKIAIFYFIFALYMIRLVLRLI